MRDWYERILDWLKIGWCAMRGHQWEDFPTYQYQTLFHNMQTGQELSRGRVHVYLCSRCPATKTETKE